MSDATKRALALAESVLGTAQKGLSLLDMNIFDASTWDFLSGKKQAAFSAVDWISIAEDMAKKGKLDLTAFLSMPAWVKKTKIGSDTEKKKWWLEAVKRYQAEVKSGKSPLFDERKKVGGVGFHYKRPCSLWKDVRAEAMPETRDIRRDDVGKVTYKEAEDDFIRMIQKISAAVMRGAKDKKESLDTVLLPGLSAEHAFFSLVVGLSEMALEFRRSDEIYWSEDDE